MEHKEFMYKRIIRAPSGPGHREPCHSRSTTTCIQVEQQRIMECDSLVQQCRCSNLGPDTSGHSCTSMVTES